jgi:hypothetical protein
MKLLEYIHINRVNEKNWVYIKSAISTVFENHVYYISNLIIIYRKLR